QRAGKCGEVGLQDAVELRERSQDHVAEGEVPGDFARKRPAVVVPALRVPPILWKYLPFGLQRLKHSRAVRGVEPKRAVRPAALTPLRRPRQRKKASPGKVVKKHSRRNLSQWVRFQETHVAEHSG